MSIVDFQIAFSKLIASPKLCVMTLENEQTFFSEFNLSEKEKRRLHSVLRQKGMSACCSLYRTNRLTPIYMQLGNTSTLLGDQFIIVIREFWQCHNETSLQFKEEVLEFGKFLMNKIDNGAINIPYLKEVLKLEIAMNEISYLREGEYRTVKFEYNIFDILESVTNSTTNTAKIKRESSQYKIYLQNQKLQMDIIS